MLSEANYVAGEAVRWARSDPLIKWVNQADDGPLSIEEVVREYLGSHNPFPDEMRVEVQRRDEDGWEPAVIIERVGVDEWLVEYDDGSQAWRDHHELRPGNNPAGENPGGQE